MLAARLRVDSCVKWKRALNVELQELSKASDNYKGTNLVANRKSSNVDASSSHME